MTKAVAGWTSAVAPALLDTIKSCGSTAAALAGSLLKALWLAAGRALSAVMAACAAAMGVSFLVVKRGRSATVTGAHAVMTASRAVMARARPIIISALRNGQTALLSVIQRARTSASASFRLAPGAAAKGATLARSALWRDGRPGNAGLLAISFAMLILLTFAITSGPKPVQIRPDTLYPIPERLDAPATLSSETIGSPPGLDAPISTKAEAPLDEARSYEAGGEKNVVEQKQPPEGLQTGLIEDGPLNDIIAYIAEQPLRPPLKPSSSPAPSIPGGDLLATAETIAELGQFVRAARTVGLDALLRPNEAYTIFIPNDAAFTGLGQNEIEELLAPSGHERLLTLLSHHVLRQRLAFSDFAGEVERYTSLADRTVTISATDFIRVDGAAMVETDLEATNGVIHVIDKVLTVPEPATDVKGAALVPFVP